MAYLCVKSLFLLPFVCLCVSFSKKQKEVRPFPKAKKGLSHIFPKKKNSRRLYYQIIWVKVIWIKEIHDTIQGKKRKNLMAQFSFFSWSFSCKFFLVNCNFKSFTQSNMKNDRMACWKVRKQHISILIIILKKVIKLEILNTIKGVWIL